jgi:tripartite-type tricarboxylate transporter receptor subunit TctC
MKRGILQMCFVWFVLGLFAPSIVAAADTPFYKGKTLTVLINYATGGPTDIEGRLVAKHLPKHIPGQPFVIVNNMPGAGGITATNYLGEVAKPDGLTMAYFTGTFFNILLSDPTLRVDMAKFAYIASIEGASIAYIRKDVAPGLNDAHDILKAQMFRAGGLSVASTKDVRFRMELDLLGAKY